VKRVKVVSETNKFGPHRGALAKWKEKEKHKEISGGVSAAEDMKAIEEAGVQHPPPSVVFHLPLVLSDIH
jgi:hypothetical protein